MEVEAAAKAEPKLTQKIQEIENTLKSQQPTIQNLTQLAEEIGVRVMALFISAPLLGVERTIPRLIIIGKKKGERRPMRPGKVQRREFEYIRHGTQTLIANFHVATGRMKN